MEENGGVFIRGNGFFTVRDLCDRFIVLHPADAVREGESQIEACASSFEELYRISSTFRRLADDQHLVITIK